MVDSKQQNSSGFTIVELLIVVVVIAILAAIIIVSYNGITQQAQRTSLQSSAKQAANKIGVYKVTNDQYPPSLAGTDIQDIVSSDGGKWAYTVSGNDYCLSVGSSKITNTYYISNTTGVVQEGLCAGHTLAMLSNGYPTRGGYTDITEATYPGDNTEVQIGSVPDGAWMIVVLAYTNANNPTPPAGWTLLIPRHTVNTLQVIAYAKIKQSGDANQQLFNAAGTTGETTSNGVFLWGMNAQDVSNWTVGSFGDRASNATSTTTLTPTVTTTVPNSLVLSMSAERTSAAETNYVSLTGVNPWIWIPQPAALPNKMQTIAIGYEEKSTPGVSNAMTVTYPNAMSTNGTAVQVVIPPAS